jgi:hypothetical protein
MTDWNPDDIEVDNDDRHVIVDHDPPRTACGRIMTRGVFTHFVTPHEARHSVTCGRCLTTLGRDRSKP